MGTNSYFKKERVGDNSGIEKYLNIVYNERSQ